MDNIKDIEFFKLLGMAHDSHETFKRLFQVAIDDGILDDETIRYVNEHIDKAERYFKLNYPEDEEMH